MSSKSFGKSVNPCGRRISYPKFSALNTNQTPPPVTIAPAPGTDVEDSVCQAYYADKTPASASPECKACWQTALDSDAECPCNFDEANPCAFARCVHKEFNKPVSRCANAFAALYNLDDVNDDKFQPPFDYSQLKNCPQITEEGYGQRRIPSIVLLVLLVITLKLFLPPLFFARYILVVIGLFVLYEMYRRWA